MIKHSIAGKYPDLVKHYSAKNVKSVGSIQPLGQLFFWICTLCKKDFERKIGGVSGKTAAITCKKCRYISVRNKHLSNSLNSYGTLGQLTSYQLANFDFKKNDKRPEDITVNSKEFIFIRCKFKHNTRRRANSFFKLPVCLKCARQTSKLELRIFCEFHKYFTTALWQSKVENIEFDILLPGLNIAIEVDGEKWHKNNEKGDLKKNKFAKENNILLIRYRAGGLKELSNSFVTSEKSESLRAFKEFCNFLITKRFSTKITAFAKWWLQDPVFKNQEKFLELLSRLPAPPKEKSLGGQFPELVEEWSDLNLPLTIFDINPFSTMKLYWKCQKSKVHPDYSMTGGHRVAGKKCPYCAGRRVAPDNSLAALKPGVAKRWNYEENSPLTPNDITAGTTKLYWWKCENGHKWQDAPAWLYENKLGQRNCLECRSLKMLFPKLAKEWHPTKNKKKANEINAYSNKKAWWICPECSHEYQMLISNRTHKTYPQKCPKHSRERQIKSRQENFPYEKSFEYLKPVPCKNWDFKKNLIKPAQVGASSTKRFFFVCECGNSTTRQLSGLRSSRKLTCRCLQKIINL